MKDKEVIAKIKKLKRIEPNQEWLFSTREKLNFEAQAEPAFWRFLKAPQLAGVLASLLVIFAGPWLMLKASEKSVPGDMLYAVKRFSEDARVKMPGVDQVNLQTEFANRRIRELSQVNLDNLSTDNEKSQKALEAIGGLRSNLTQLNSRIEEDVNDGKRQEIAEFTKESEQIEQRLSEVENRSPEGVQDELAEVKKMLSEIKNFALTSLYNNEEKTGSSTPEALNGETSTTTKTTTTDEVIEEPEDEEVSTTTEK